MANNTRNSSFHAEDDLISSFCSDDLLTDDTLNINSRPFVLQRKRTVWQRISVEPVMFLYMFAFMMTTVIEDSFFLDKACRVNLGFPANICDHINLKNNTVYKKQVQIVVSNFRQYEGIALHAVPMVLALLLGSWSDKHGRKFPMLLGLSGALFYALMIIVNTLQDWPLEVVLFTATFPSAMTGSALAIFLAAFTYISDITKPKNRTSRVTLLEVSYLITMPTGLAAGSYVFTHLVNRSYTLMFCIHAVLVTIAIIYATLTMETYSNRFAETGGSSYVVSKSEETNMLRVDERPSRCCLLDIWDWNIIVDTFKTVFRKRTENRRMYLLLIILAMGFYTFQRDEKHMVYLYTQLKFHWPVDEYSRFRTFQSAFFLLGLLVGVPMVRAFSLPDTIVIMFGCISHSIARVIFATAIQPSVFYIGAAVAAFGPVVAPVLRSMTSKLVPASERGKVFSMLTVADTSLPVISGAIYTQVYNATIDTLPSAFFWVTVTTQILVFIIALVIHCSLGGKLIEQAEDDKHFQDQLVSDNSVQNIENT